MASTRAARPLLLGMQPGVRAGCSCRADCGCAPRRDPYARPAPESVGERTTRPVPDGGRPPAAGGVGGGLHRPASRRGRARTRLPQRRAVPGRRTAHAQTRRRSRRRCCGDRTRGGDRQRQTSCPKFVSRRRQCWARVAAYDVGPVRRRAERAVARQHARAEQLGQSIPRADLDLAGMVGRSARVDSRLMPSCSPAVDIEPGV